VHDLIIISLSIQIADTADIHVITVVEYIAVVLPADASRIVLRIIRRRSLFNLDWDTTSPELFVYIV